MSRIKEAFRNRKALITFITAGDPSLSVTEKLIFQLEKAGADIIELGIPFSDPLADGPVIQASHQRALKKGTTLADVFKLVAKVRKRTQVPICFMLSYNLILQFGEDKFYAACAEFGVDGVVIPDLPPEEGHRVIGSRGIEDIKMIRLIAPTSTEERIKLAAENSTGFIYLISVAGITGKRRSLGENLAGIIARIRKYSQLPIAIGFGISNPQQAAEAAKLADGVIVGSAIVDLIAKKKIAAVPRFISSFRRAIDGR